MVLLVKNFKEKINICGRQNQRLQEEHLGEIYSISLIVPQTKRKLVTPQVVKQIIYSCAAFQNITQHCPPGHKRCFICQRSKGKSTDLLAVHIVTQPAKDTAMWSVISVIRAGVKYLSIVHSTTLS